MPSLKHFTYGLVITLDKQVLSTVAATGVYRALGSIRRGVTARPGVGKWTPSALCYL